MILIVALNGWVVQIPIATLVAVMLTTVAVVLATDNLAQAKQGV